MTAKGIFGRFFLLSTIILFISFSFNTAAQVNNAQEGMQVKEDNFTRLKQQPKAKNLESWRKLNDAKYSTHPEFGILMENAPCENCVELLARRKVDERYYVDENDTNKFYIQKAFGELHVQQNGNWVTIDHELKKLENGAFLSDYYLNPITIDPASGIVRMKVQSGEINLNNWKLYKSVGGEMTLLSSANWTNFTAGDDGIHVTNIFDGIDAQFIVQRGAIKTNFIIKKNKFGTFDELIFRDALQEFGDNVTLSSAENPNEEKFVGNVGLSLSGTHVASISPGIAYPEGGAREEYQALYYSIQQQALDVIVPFSLISKYDGKRKLIIDPLVSGTASLAQVSILGSQYNASCNFDNSCNYNLTVAAPANATFTNVLWSFEYVATFNFFTINECWMEDGAVRFSTGGCLSPSQAGFFWFCNQPDPGTCTGTNVGIMNDLGGCLPPPSCVPQNVTFTMQFLRRCFGDTGCGNACIGANSPWTMTIEGLTVEHSNVANPITLSSPNVCEGAAITATTNGQNGVPGYTYNWSFSPTGTPSVGAGASASITFPTAGNQTLYSIITDFCGNISTTSTNVNVVASPVPTITGNSVYCPGQSASISTQAFSSYSWSTGATTQSINVTAANNPITVTVTNASGCSGTSAPFNVSESPLPTPTIIGDVSYCAGSTASIGTQSYSSYAWSSGGTGQNITVTAANNPMTVTVTDANGCTGTSAPFNVTENPSPNPTITGATTYCAGNTVTISTQNFPNYNWSTGGTTQSDNVTNANNPITVTVTDINGCSGTSAPFSVTEELNIQYSETIEICQGQTATIHGSAESTAGIYQQTFTTPTCDSIATITLVVNPSPTITASATLQEFCIGGNTVLSAAGGNTYTWNNGLGAGASHTVSPGTTTTYEVTGTAANSCSNTAQIQITVNQLPTVTAGTNVGACLGDNVTLSGGGAVTYVWDNGVVDGDPFTTGLGTTTYTVEGTDANGCTNSASVDVTVNPLPTIDAGIDQDICDGDDVTLSGTGAVSYTWDNGVVNGTPFTPGIGSNVYTVTGVDANGCVNTAAVTVNVVPAPIADFTATPLTGAVPLNVTFTNNSSNGTTYTWDFGNGDSDVTSSPITTNTTYTEPGEYSVVLVTNNGLCSSTATTLIITLNLPLSYNLPNIFTPNNDNSNDIMHLSIVNAKRVNVEILNRWGVQVGVIDSVDPNNGWKGLDMKTGKPVSDGVYFYKYEIEDLNGEVLSGHHFIHIKR